VDGCESDDEFWGAPIPFGFGKVALSGTFVSTGPLVKKFRIGSSEALLMCQKALYPFWWSTTSRKEDKMKRSRSAKGSVSAQYAMDLMQLRMQSSAPGLSYSLENSFERTIKDAAKRKYLMFCQQMAQ
jgi:hypothetical protein